MMEMLTAIDPMAFEWANYHAEDKEHSLPIRVAREEEKNKSFATLAHNVAISNNIVTLKTRYNYDYKPQQHLNYRDKWYEIVSIKEIEKNRTPQVLMFSFPQIVRETMLQIVEVEWNE